MAINLQKGQKVSLSKESPGLSKVIVGLGWDEAPQPKGLLSLFTGKQDIDCDASAILLKNGRLVNREDLVYFGNLKHKTGTVLHMGDNLTGAGEGDDGSDRVHDLVGQHMHQFVVRLIFFLVELAVEFPLFTFRH